MPKIIAVFEYENEEVLQKIAKDAGIEFSSIDDYADRELRWSQDSGFDLQSVILEDIDVDGILRLRTKVNDLMAKSEAEEHIDTGECLDIFNEFLGCFDKEG